MSSVFSRIQVRLGLDKVDFEAKLNGAEKSLTKFQSRLSKFGLGKLGPFASVAAGIASMNSAMRRFAEDDAFRKKYQEAAQFTDALKGMGLDAKSIWDGVGATIMTGISKASKFAAGLYLGSQSEAAEIFDDYARANREDPAIKRNNELLEEQRKLHEEISKIRERRAEAMRRDEQAEVRYVNAVTAVWRAQKDLDEAHTADRHEQLRLTVKLEEARLRLTEAQLARDAERASRAKKEAEEREREEERLAEIRKRNAERLADAQERTAEMEKEAAREAMTITSRISDLQEEIAKLRKDGTRDTIEGNDALQRALLLEKRLNSELKTKNDQIKETRKQMSEIVTSAREVQKQIRDIKIPGHQFTLEEAASGRRGSRSDQRSAQRILREEERNREDMDRWRWYTDQGRTREANQIAASIQGRRSRIALAREGISGLRDEDRDPLAAARAQLEVLRNQFEVQKQTLEEMRKL